MTIAVQSVSAYAKSQSDVGYAGLGQPDNINGSVLKNSRLMEINGHTVGFPYYTNL